MYHISIAKDKPDSKRLLKNVTEMMERGVRVKDINLLMEQFEKETTELYSRITDKYGIANPNSSAQIGQFMNRKSMEVPYGSRNDYIENCYINGKWVTAADVLSKMSLLGYEFADDILQYREAKKNFDSIKQISDGLDENGMIHPIVSQTKTNRISYKEPALMSIRKQLLWYVIAPLTDDYVLYSIDIKNQEPGILINALKDEDLLAALRSDEGLYEHMFKLVFKPFARMNLLKDTLMEDRIYTQEELMKNIIVSAEAYVPMKAPCMSWYLNGKRIVEVQQVCQGISDGCEIEYPTHVAVEFEDGTADMTPVKWGKVQNNKGEYFVEGELTDVEVGVSKQERSEFKTSFLAITYGASDKLIGERCKTIDGYTVYRKITKLQRMAEYRKQCGAVAKKGIQTMRTVFGTEVRADKYGSTNELKRSLLSIPIQGTGADILDLLIVHFREEMDKRFGADEKMKPLIYYTRHDELVICVPKLLEQIGSIEQIQKLFTDTCEHQIEDSEPFKVEVKRIHDMNIEELLGVEE